MNNNNHELAGWALDTHWRAGQSIRWRARGDIAGHTVGLRRRTYQSQGFANIGRIAPALHRNAADLALLPDGVLPKPHFLNELHREKRRTERTVAPLSIALFQLDTGQDAGLVHSGELLEILRSAKRETDVIGSLGGGRIALLLPDTNKDGAKVLSERIVKCAGVSGITAVTASYPDEVFVGLLQDTDQATDTEPVAVEDHPALDEPGYQLKRAIDIIGALVALVLFSPVMLITAIAIALTSPGPVIFRQTRIGRKGTPFEFFKFRSMRNDADDSIHREYVQKLIEGNLQEINNGSAEKPFYKMKSDPRVTRVGKFIRRTHIDELPQLFNVLKGDMSLVGPRPGLPYEVEKYEYWHLRRVLEIKPGITCLWQVNGHNATSFDDMVRLDIRYVRECSLLLDLSILLKTVKVVLTRFGE